MLDPRALSLPAKFTRFYLQQEEAISRILSSPSRFVAPFAPTASGKTLIYMTARLLLGLDALVLVHTKALQSQIMADSFPGTYSISGHRNYCPLGPQSEDDADDAGCPLRKDCRHRPEVETAARSAVVVTNYHFALAVARSSDPDRLGPRPLLILDEAHGIHDTLTEQMAVDLYPSRVQHLLSMSMPRNTLKLSDWVEWAKEARASCSSRLDHLAQYTNSGPDIRRLSRLARSLSRFLDNIDTAHYIVKRKDDFHAAGAIQIRPVLAGCFAQEFLFRSARKVILTSASIDKRDMADLGIAESDLDYFELPSVIHPSRRPIYYTPTIPPLALKHPISDGEVKVFASRADDIMLARLDRRGLLATQSYQLNARILAESKCQELIVTHNQQEGATDAVTRFMAAGTPSVIASPAIREGWDFPYSACSYLVIFKIPFPDTKGAPELAERCHLDPTFRMRFASRIIEQTAGRIVRTPQDIGEIFILDAQWGNWFCRQAEFHSYFRAAIVDWSGKPGLPTPPVLDYATPAPLVELTIKSTAQHNRHPGIVPVPT